MYLLPKALTKVWGSNKTGVALFSNVLLAIGTYGASESVKLASTVMIGAICLAVIVCNGWEDAAQKGKAQ